MAFFGGGFASLLKGAPPTRRQKIGHLFGGYFIVGGRLKILFAETGGESGLLFEACCLVLEDAELLRHRFGISLVP